MLRFAIGTRHAQLHAYRVLDNRRSKSSKCRAIAFMLSHQALARRAAAGVRYDNEQAQYSARYVKASRRSSDVNDSACGRIPFMPGVCHHRHKKWPSQHARYDRAAFVMFRAASSARAFKCRCNHLRSNMAARRPHLRETVAAVAFSGRRAALCCIGQRRRQYAAHIIAPMCEKRRDVLRNDRILTSKESFDAGCSEASTEIEMANVS